MRSQALSNERGGQWRVGFHGIESYLHYDQNELRQCTNELKSVDDEGHSDTMKKKKHFSNTVLYPYPYSTFEQLFLEKTFIGSSVELLRKMFVLRAVWGHGY